MDVFSLFLTLVIMMVAYNAGQNWIVFGTLILSIISTRSMPAMIILGIGTVLLFVSKEVMGDLWPFAIFGLMILAFALGLKGEGQQPEYYSPMGSDLLGGGGAPPGY